MIVSFAKNNKGAYKALFFRLYGFSKAQRPSFLDFQTMEIKKQATVLGLENIMF
jgi:hypothetical protein